MKRKKEWVSLLAALGAGLFVCGACLHRIAITPGILTIKGVYSLDVKNLGIGTKKDDVMIREMVTDFISQDLYQGNCFVGEDLPAGEYRVNTKTGGRTEIGVYENGELVEVHVLADEEGAPLYEIVTWKEGQVLIVKGDDARAVSENALEYEKVDYWGSYDPYKCYLYAGEYVVGRDIPAGIYDFTEYGDQRTTIESSHPYDGGISFVFEAWTDDEQERYCGVRLQEGDTLTVDGDGMFSQVEVAITIP